MNGPLFRAGRSYDHELDVRDHEGFAGLIRGGFPDGPFWAMVGTRRAGKTWAVRALARELGDAARVLDLRDDEDAKAFAKSSPKPILLIDEPGSRLDQDPARFLGRCATLKKKNGIKILVAMSLSEWEVARERSGGANLPHEKDLRILRLLRPAESARMIHRVPWAAALELPPAWTRGPFLLELVLEVAERNPELRADIPALLQTAIDAADEPHRYYLKSVYRLGLSEKQQTTVRKTAWGRMVTQEESELLIQCGLLVKEAHTYRLADPVLAAYIPPPLYIHHLSDIHVGDKSADAADVKVKGTLGERLKEGVASGPVRERYLFHLQKLQGEGRAPHLVVISGDIAERGDRALYDQLADWFAALKALLADHPHLAKDLPRILLVGGNHDVDWNQVLGAEGVRNRHKPFAEAFAGYPHPGLDQPPATRANRCAEYPELGLAILLLGSAEFGGEVEVDPERKRLIAIIEDLRTQIVAEPDADKTSDLLDRVSRIDPGLVHHKDLERAMAHACLQPVKIAVLHHPVSPMPPTEVAHFAGLINAGQVKGTLFAKKYALVLHGHMHTGWFAREHWQDSDGSWQTLHIAAAPTLGSRETTEKHGFNEITINREGTHYTLSVCRIVRDGENWNCDGQMSFSLGEPLVASET